MSSTASDNTIPSPQVGGGKIWTVPTPTVSINSSVFKNDLKSLINVAVVGLSLIAALVMTVVGYVQVLNIPAQKTGDFFLVFTPFSQGWELYFLCPIFAVFLVSLIRLLYTKGNPIGAMLAIIITGMLILLTVSSAMVASSVRAGSVEEWLQNTQGLSQVALENDFASFTTGKPFLLQDKDEKTYAVIFNYDDKKLSIVSKTELVESE